MKLRMRSNSIRLRLGPREVSALLAVGSLQETVRFAPGDGQLLHYRVELADRVTRVSARIEQLQIVVTVPRSTAQIWADAQTLSLEVEQPVGDGRPLQILIEKDLQCRDAPALMEDDVYPNPSSDCAV